MSAQSSYKAILNKTRAGAGGGGGVAFSSDRVPFSEHKGLQTTQAIKALLGLWCSGTVAEKIIRSATKPNETRETLDALIEEIEQQTHLKAEIAHKSVNELSEEDFPLVVLGRFGQAFILESKNDDTIAIRQSDGVSSISTNQAMTALSEVCFILRPTGSMLQNTITPQKGEKLKKDSNALPILGHSKLITYLLDFMINKNKSLVLELVFAAFLSNFSILVLPIFIMTVYDRVVPHAATATLWALALGVMIIFAIDLGLKYVRLKFSDAIALKASLALQEEFYKKLSTMKFSKAPRTMGNLTNINSEAEELCVIIPSILTTLVADLPFIILVIALISHVSGPVFLAPILGMVLLLAVNLVAFKFSKKYAAMEHQLTYKKINQLSETVDGLATVKTQNMQHRLLQKWKINSDDKFYLNHLSRLYTGYASQVTAIISQAMVVVAMIIGVYQITNGNMTVGNLAAATLLVGRVLAPISMMLSLLIRGYRLISSTTEIELILTMEAEEGGDETTELSKLFQGNFSFRNVTFSYPDTEKPSLENVSLDIRKGEHFGIIGGSGSGKTTFLNMFTRLHDPESGSILLDGCDLRQYDPDFLREKIGFMSQDVMLFDGTVMDNITCGAEITQDNLMTAVNVSGIASFIKHNPQGFSMQVGPRGTSLSGGQRQAVALARTLARNPDIIILDEPTSAMDNQLEAHVMKELLKFANGKTIILSTHKMGLLNHLDKVAWFAEGKMIAAGPRDDVLKLTMKQAG